MHNIKQLPNGQYHCQACGAQLSKPGKSCGTPKCHTAYVRACLASKGERSIDFSPVDTSEEETVSIRLERFLSLDWS